MTKKAEKIYKEYVDKLELEMSLYNFDMWDASKARKNIFELEREFVNLISGMVSYYLISNKDFSELMDLAFPTCMKYYDRI